MISEAKDMLSSVMEEVEKVYKSKVFLTVNDVAEILGCSIDDVHNLSRLRKNLKKPPRITVFNEIRYPKKAFVEWLIEERGL